MTTITNKKQYPSEQYLNELITNIEFAARAPVDVVRAMAAELQKRREADSAEPVAYIFKHPAGKLFWSLTDESNKEQADVIPVYAAAPASVVPDNASEPLAYAYKELTPEIMRNHLAVFERYGIAPNDSSTTIHALRIALDGIERSDAMLHGAEPVSQTYKLPPLSSNEVNDAAWKLHNMLTEHGPLNGRQFNNLKGCFYEALKVAMRNSPVIPGEVLSAIMKVARVRADFDDFDGDRRGIGDCLDEAEQELIVTINKYASQLAVVPVGLDERAAFNAWNNDKDLPIAGVSAKNAAWLAWQVRAELGRSLAVNSPVIPDSWISCSERMPDTKTAVLVAVEFDRKGDWRMKWATYIPGHPDANDGWIIPGASWKPSHWMRLPEPPQEAK